MRSCSCMWRDFPAVLLPYKLPSFTVVVCEAFHGYTVFFIFYKNTRTYSLTDKQKN